MQSLKELVEQKQEDENIQRSQAVIVTPSEAEWIKHKQIVNGLTGNYIEVLKVKLDKNPRDVHTNQYTIGKGKTEVINYTVEFPELSEKFDTSLLISEVDGRVQKVRYLAFNTNPARVYIKNIIG